MSLDQELDQIFTPTPEPTGGNGQPAAGNTETKQTAEWDGPKSPEAVLLRLSDVKPQPLRWLWPGRIPLGKLSMLIGDPGLGKSLVTLDVASRVSTGTPWPDATSVENTQGAVVLLSAEDDPEDTIAPRLMAAGADLTKIVALKAVRCEVTEDDAGGEFPFSLAGDMPILEKTIETVGGVRLIIIDPISAYLGGRTDSHKDADVRRVLAPLADMAAKHRLAVLAISHLNKRPGVSVMYRAMGSMAFTAAARAVWAVCKDKDDAARRLVLPVKVNLARDPTGMAYSIRDGLEGIGIVAWEAEPVTISAESALSDRGEAPALAEAVEWLENALANGPRPYQELAQDAKANGITKGTLRRAKRRLSIESVKVAGGWEWSLPIQGAQETHVAHLAHLESESPLPVSEGCFQGIQGAQGGQGAQARDGDHLDQVGPPHGPKPGHREPDRDENGETALERAARWRREAKAEKIVENP